MISRKLFPIVAAALLLCGVSTHAFAELFSIGVGVPIQHTFTSEWDNGDTVESEGVSGYMAHVKLPIMLGLGYENYKTNIESFNDAQIDDISLTIEMLDIFWLTPIPIINFTVGAGVGRANYDCEYKLTDQTCSDVYEDGELASAYQWYMQLGYNFLPLLDAHVSYHNVTAKVKEKDGGDTDSFNGNVLALGVSIIF